MNIMFHMVKQSSFLRLVGFYVAENQIESFMDFQIHK